MIHKEFILIFFASDSLRSTVISWIGSLNKRDLTADSYARPLASPSACLLPLCYGGGTF